MPEWSEWKKFPGPPDGILVAPFGPGVYELRHGDQLLLFGWGTHCAQRMTSLLPPPHGTGGRRNYAKRSYVLENLAEIEYRTLPCATTAEARSEEDKLRKNRDAYVFNERRAARTRA